MFHTINTRARQWHKTQVPDVIIIMIIVVDLYLRNSVKIGPSPTHPIQQ
jgi:hypothetical protein